MKKTLILMPFFFFSKVFSQFNTVSYRDRLNSVAVATFSENRFGASFLSYHIDKKPNKKTIEQKEAEKSKEPKSEAFSEKQAVRTEKTGSADLEEDLPIQVNDDPVEKRIRYKKLNLITSGNYDFTEEQTVFMPLKKMTITSNYGNRFHPVDKVEKFHAGVDLRANSDYVFAVLNGIVSDAGHNGGAGNYIRIRHGDFEMIYMHLSRTFFSEGDIIYAGDIIALSGNTGKSTAPHLHFAVKENGKYIDPIQFLNDLIQTNNAIADYNNGK